MRRKYFKDGPGKHNQTEQDQIGVEAEKEVEVKVTFPEEYHAENLQGKDTPTISLKKENPTR